jgi:hypothetical protein
MSEENERAAQRAHRNVGLPDEEYDDEGRPAAARARDADPGVSGAEPSRRADQEPEDEA